MKSKLLIIAFLSIFMTTFSQVKKIKRNDILEINKEWRLIKTNSNTYGIMDQNGKIIVQSIYSKIEKFGEYDKNLALVKNVSDGYGFIDKTGKEIIPAHFEINDIKSGFHSLYKKYVTR